MVGQLIVQPSFLAEQHVLLRLVDWSQVLYSYTALCTRQLHSAIHYTSYAAPLWSQGHPSPLG